MPRQPARLTLVVGRDQYLKADTRLTPEGALDLAAALIAAAENEASRPIAGHDKVAFELIAAGIVDPIVGYTL